MFTNVFGELYTIVLSLDVKIKLSLSLSLTHSARTPPAVHQGITIWVDEIEFEKK